MPPEGGRGEALLHCAREGVEQHHSAVVAAGNHKLWGGAKSGEGQREKREERAEGIKEKKRKKRKFLSGRSAR